MRVVLFANGPVGIEVAQCLRVNGDDIVGVVLHPPDRSRSGEEIRLAAGTPAERVIDGSNLHAADSINFLRGLSPDIGVSAFFGYILKPEILDLFPGGCINLHPSYLPYNRGAHPNVWSIVTRTPAGVTIHYMDNGVDTGDIIARRSVPVRPTDTGQSLYVRLEEECKALFRHAWPAIRRGDSIRVPQDDQEGSTHRVADIRTLDEIDLDRSYSGRELIDILRARTFPPYPGAYFRDRGSRVYVRIELWTDSQDEDT